MEENNTDINPTPPVSQPEQTTPVSNGQKKKLPLAIIIGIILAVLLVSSAAGFYVLKQQSPKIAKPTPIVQKQIPTPVPAVTPDQSALKVTDLISFTTPAGWVGKYLHFEKSPGYPTPNPIYKIVSPDLAPGEAGSPPTNALGISFSVSKNEKTHTLEKKYQEIYGYIHDPNPGGATNYDLTKTTIGGYPAISYYYNFEGYQHTYNVWQNDYVWEIVISAADPKQETIHSTDINSVLSSIKFTSPTPSQSQTIDTSNWKTYTNSKYGFTFSYPPTAVSNQASCVKDEFGYRNVEGLVPVSTIEEGNTVTVATDYIYKAGGNIVNANNQTHYSECTKTKTTTGMGNIIKAGIAKNDKDLDTFLKDNFDKRCSFYKKEPATNYTWSTDKRKEVAYNVFSINDKGQTQGTDDNYCAPFGPILYYPEKNLVLYFRFGQDCNLFGQGNIQTCYSAKIGDSLKPL